MSNSMSRILGLLQSFVHAYKGSRLWLYRRAAVVIPQSSCVVIPQSSCSITLTIFLILGQTAVLPNSVISANSANSMCSRWSRPRSVIIEHAIHNSLCHLANFDLRLSISVSMNTLSTFFAIGYERVVSTIDNPSIASAGLLD